jgi:hypothetical protein
VEKSNEKTPAVLHKDDDENEDGGHDEDDGEAEDDKWEGR